MSANPFIFDVDKLKSLEAEKKKLKADYTKKDQELENEIYDIMQSCTHLHLDGKSAKGVSGYREGGSITEYWCTICGAFL